MSVIRPITPDEALAHSIGVLDKVRKAWFPRIDNLLIETASSEKWPLSWMKPNDITYSQLMMIKEAYKKEGWDVEYLKTGTNNDTQTGGLLFRLKAKSDDSN